jgi:hypothetical protein
VEPLADVVVTGEPLMELGLEILAALDDDDLFGEEVFHALRHVVRDADLDVVPADQRTREVEVALSPLSPSLRQLRRYGRANAPLDILEEPERSDTLYARIQIDGLAVLSITNEEARARTRARIFAPASKVTLLSAPA